MAPIPGIISLISIAPGVPGQMMLSPQVAPALPISPVMESIATMENVCCENPVKGRINSSIHKMFLMFLFGLGLLKIVMKLNTSVST